jgi:peptidoglycan-N-acetylglucosamine deacetylase
MSDARPVFYDQSGRRRRRFNFGVASFVALLLLAGIAFAISVFEVKPQPLLPMQVERPNLRADPDRAQTAHPHAAPRLNYVTREVKAMMARWQGQAASKPLAIAFHAPWDDSSVASLKRHVEDLDWLIPGWISVTGQDHKVTEFADPRGKAILNHAVHRPLLLPMVQNALNGDWDGPGMAALLQNKAARTQMLDRLEPLLIANRAGGAFFDFEELPVASHAAYRQFLTEARARFAPRHWIIAIAVPVDDPDWNLPAFAAACDKIFLMDYDEHYQGGAPGPIASNNWFADRAVSASKGIARDKIVIAFGNYAYDWVTGGATDANGVEEEWLAAKESEAAPIYDKASGNSHFEFDENGTHHTVWMLDAASAHCQLTSLRALGFGDVALWRLGSEDPSLWTMFGRKVTGPVPARFIEPIPAGTNVDIEGNGEILKIGSLPVAGRRTVETDAKGAIIDERFTRLPAPFQIERSGYQPGRVALTFDDGPDPTWTPKILDILKQTHTPATFFIVGENALTERSLLDRIVREGHEVGSHTYTHPNLATASAETTELELNANQRLFQGFTGHTLRLFRAPYFGDAEPTTTDELIPVWRAQQLGYLSVGLHVDPSDWKRPGVDTIVNQTLSQVEAGNADRSAQIVLLHDSGGDRSQTVEALPQIIARLRAKGYRFVTASELAGLSRAQAMPPVAASDQAAARLDLFLFDALGWIVIALGWIFTLAISVGIARAVVLSALALWQARKESLVIFPPIDPTLRVSVLIPAFNEAQVIKRSVETVLASENVLLDVIVIDDGSADGTSDIVRAAFGDEPRVRLLTLQNGGKARALNEGLRLAKGEIVIALDADTQFEPTTIARLARWFVDPQIAAVAGNAKVGNRINLVTKWQALEYVTAQNLERRALASLGAMTVVPGAVGAWRRAALAQVGGYPHDTLAEDQDLTIAIQRAGWKVHYDQYAVAWTEAPESVAALSKQRFRWAFGTLQCLWKHRRVIGTGTPRGLALVGLPQAIVFQIFFAAISPIIDLALVISIVSTFIRVEEHGWAQTSTDLEKMALFWIVFSLIDLLSGAIAFALERKENWRLLWLMIPQRFGYRQVMYYVVLKAMTQALRGPRVGWGKLDRSGRVGAQASAP